MTVDELIDLVDALLQQSGFTLSNLRGGDPEIGPNLSDEQFLLAVRFVAGERPSPSATVPAEYTVGPPRPRAVTVLTEDEAARRLADLEALDEVLGPVEIGEGITLL